MMFPPGYLSGSGGGLTSVDISDINATGTADGTTYLRGDGAWAAVAGGSSVSFMHRKSGLTRGSTMTKNVIYGTAVASVGSDITYQNSAINGDSFKINTAGLYVVEVQIRGSALPVTLTVHKNTTQNNPPQDFSTETDNIGGAYETSSSVGRSVSLVNCAINDLIWVALSNNGTVANWNYIKITGPFEVAT